jgi:hypothetical protein
MLHIKATHTEEMRNVHVLVGKPEGKRPLGRRMHKLEDNIKMNLIEREWGGGGV